MKVLLVTPSYYPIIGGSETALRILCAELNKIGVQTDVMTFNMNRKWKPILREKTESEGLFKVFREPAFNPEDVFRTNPLQLLQLYVIPAPGFIRRFKEYSIVHFQGEADVSFLFFSFFVRKRKIWTSHANTARLPRMKRLFKLFFPHLADLYIAHQIELLSDLGVPRSKSLVLDSFGVDANTFRPNEAQRINNLILFVGRIRKRKGLHILLEALSQVVVPVRVIVIGPKFDTSKSDIEYADECMERVEKINHDGFHRVDYLGPMDEKDLVPWYQKATVLVRADLDGFSGGVTTLEAMACATPVIGTGNHLLKNGVNGVIVPPGDARKLGEAINKLLGSRSLRRVYGVEGRRLIKECYSWEKIVTNLANLYRALARM